MQHLSFFGELLETILRRRMGFAGSELDQVPDRAALEELCRELLSSRGEVSGMRLAARINAAFANLDASERLAFFRFLASEFGPDPERLVVAAQAFIDDRSQKALSELLKAAEPPRQELFRRLNALPDGTERLVRMRESLFEALDVVPEFKSVDGDFRHLLKSWFNRGFLVLKRIDWSTSADILEKIIAYEAVHEIDSWADAKLRLMPADRRCFAFFHPAMPDEPLIFVEVALTRGISASIQDVLAEDRPHVPPENADTAVFYSISNCQPGLRGISFGAFLIKQVASVLSAELANLSQFVTLSPVPGFVDWLKLQPNAENLVEGLDLLDDDSFDWKDEQLKSRLTALAAHYLVQEKQADGAPLDPVARFHIGNGARLERINWLADVTKKGLRQSAGIMVNYNYQLDEIENNHEAYAANFDVAVSNSVARLLVIGNGEFGAHHAKQKRVV